MLPAKYLSIGLYSRIDRGVRRRMVRFFFFFGKRLFLTTMWVLACYPMISAISAQAQHAPGSLELSRPIRPWEFVSAVGQRAGLFGTEGGTVEAWVYPLKILSGFHLRFHVGGVAIPAEAVARTLIVHPESSTIVYTGDVFSVRETLFVPVHECGAIIAFEIQTSERLEIEAGFKRDFQLEWPASFGGADGQWDAAAHAFRFGEESGKFEAMVGSPSATLVAEEHHDNYSSNTEDAVLLGATDKGSDKKILIIAATLNEGEKLPELFSHLAKDYPELLKSSAAYYRDYLQRTVSLELPDQEMERGYDWARVDMLQGVVENPLLGKGLIAGYNKSGENERPGFAWFFGRDAEWTSLALNAEGDFSTARQALEFVGKFQRADGKMPHEIAQSASFVDWFHKTPYAYASADSTPLFIVAVDDYVTRSGDAEFARTEWDRLWLAYQFLRSTYDVQGLAQNAGVGTGWIEGGPLVPVRTEIYQAAVGVEALRALSHLAHLLGKEDVAKDLQRTFEEKRKSLNAAFWSPEKGIYAYAIGTDNERSDIPSVLAAVPMWFRQLNDSQAVSLVQRLAAPDQQADWGMRILSSRDPRYGPDGYHYGAVWPLFTGWASVGEYRYHQPIPAYLNLRANALLALDGSLGHVTEVLTGDSYQTLSTGTPHQIWSAAMVVNPILSGLLGLEADATSCHVKFAPHVPADWNAFSVDHLVVGPVTLNLRYQRTADKIELQMQSSGAGKCSLEFAPAVSLRATVLQAQLNGRTQSFHVQANAWDQHVSVEAPVEAKPVHLQIDLKDDFEIAVSSAMPALGGPSKGLRVLSQTWTPERDVLRVIVSGAPGENYEFSASNPSQIASVEGAEVDRAMGTMAGVRVQMPTGSDKLDPQTTIVFHFARR